MGGADLGPRDQHAEVAPLDHVAWLDHSGEAWPAGVAVELAGRGEQRFAGHDVDVDAGLLVVPVLVPEWRLGAALLRDLVLLRGKPGDSLRIFAVVFRHVSSLLHGPARRRMPCTRIAAFPAVPSRGSVAGDDGLL